jgi:hypothetical protein
MRMIVHDLLRQDFEAIDIRADSDIVVSDNGNGLKSRSIKKRIGGQ